MSILITGASGYLGELLARRLQNNGRPFIAVDILPAEEKLSLGKYYQGNLCDQNFVHSIFENHPIQYVFHFATQIDFKATSQNNLYNNNIVSTQTICEISKKYKIKKLIFTSSNSVFLGNKFTCPFTEDILPIPIDAYGKSKLFCEDLLRSYQSDFDSIIFRCPNIIDSGRIGMLAILFDFVKENKICWQIGNGNIKHQCIYAQDLLDAILLSLEKNGSYTFNIGSKSISTIKEINTDLIKHAKSNSKIKSLPKIIMLPLLKLLYRLKLSPLGPYQFRMLTQDFSFDISFITKTLTWQPTLSNSQMLIKAYDFYVNNQSAIASEKVVSANKSKVKMGVIELVKKLS